MKRSLISLSYALLLYLLLFCNSCTNLYDQEKYQRPEWLAGKLFTQITTIEDLGSFQRCLELTGYDTILDRAGSFTIFAPNDVAFQSYLFNHPEYQGSIENIPIDELLKIVRMHIIQDAWTLQQLQLLDVDGWIDPNDPRNSYPRAYKRRTLLRDPDKKYWIENNKGKITLVDSLSANGYRMVYTRARKYVPIFFPGYFSLYNISYSDYAYYFHRTYEEGSIHYANAKVIGNEVFAENGFIYEVDQVVEPLLNAEQILSDNIFGENYSYLKELLMLTPSFTLDMEATSRQTEAKMGLNYDSLYNLTYPHLTFNVHEELTGPDLSEAKYTLRYHNGLLAPTDKAFETLIEDVLTKNSGYPHWNDWKSIPLEIKYIILNNHMTTTPVYPTDMSNGFYTGEGDRFTIDEEVIVDKIYGSNCTFIGLNSMLIPRAFTSITAPVYLRPGFSNFLYAIELTKLLPALKKENVDLSFFVISDNIFYEDSSLIFSWKSRNLNSYEFTAYDKSSEKLQKIGTKLLSKRLLNHVGLSVPDGSAKKEFIENLAGNYLIFNNDTKEVRGGNKSTFGYNGSEQIIVYANQLSEPTDNGMTFEVNSWLLPPKLDMFTALSSPSRSKFLELLAKAGLYNSKTYKFEFLSEGEIYTIFVPSEEALINFGADTLAPANLEALLRYHFIKGYKIFTDGKVPSGEFKTLRIDESSTPMFLRFSNLSVKTGADEIQLYDQENNLLGTINEAEDITNIMITSSTEVNSGSGYDNITSSVLHDIDFVIHK